MATLLYLHGVGGLRPGWADGLLSDLLRRGVAVEVIAPTYADLLAADGGSGPMGEGSTSRAAFGSTAARDPVGDGARAAYVERQARLAELLGRSGDALPPGLSWPVGLPRPGLLSDRLPLPRVLRTPVLGLDQVGRYLDEPHRREAVLTRTRSAVARARGPITIVGHSLGSLVAVDLLTELDREVSLLVTLGSPLGHAAVADRRGPLATPYERLGGWVNVVHLLDPVPFGRGLRDRFPAALDVYLPVLSGVDGATGLLRGLGRAATAHLDSTYLASDTVRTAISHGLQAAQARA